MTLASGSRLGPYEILAPIGAGGMGEVYRALDPSLGREVAIKVLPASFSADPDRLRRFEQEARAAGILNHPNITAVHDIGTHEGAPYVVQELLEGETLRATLAGAKLPPRKAIDYALQIAHGLGAAHENDGRWLLFSGFEQGRPPRAWLLDLAGTGAPRAATPEGCSLAFLSPDGGSVATVDPDGKLLLCSVAGGAPKEVRGALPGEIPVEWEGSGKALFLWDRTWPARIVRHELDSGRRSLWKELAPDSTGLLCHPHPRRAALRLQPPARALRAKCRGGLEVRA
jgi:hypothetical protein